MDIQDGVMVATGSLDPDTKLSKMDQHLSANSLEVNDWMLALRTRAYM
jgi:hypothetical protein